MQKFFAVAAIIAVSGCSSFRTTAVDRCEHDSLVVNPDCPMKGIPVSLRVPTHMELSVVETTYWEKQDIPGKRPTLVPLITCRPTRTVLHDICYTEKVFWLIHCDQVLARKVMALISKTTIPTLKKRRTRRVRDTCKKWCTRLMTKQSKRPLT